MPKIKKAAIRKNFLSIVVPVYNQEQTIRKDLARINQVLAETRFSYEIIAVIDGKAVDHSYREAKKLKFPSLRVIGYQKNRGKGYAVRFGMARCKGDKIAFIDSGMDIDPNGISMILEHMEWYNADIVVGSKRHPVSQVKYPPLRKVYSWGYQILVRILFGLKIRDTQAGLKIARREVLEKVLPRLLVKRFAFDVELLSVANYLGFRRIYEAPIKLDRERFDFSSTIRFQTVLEMLTDTAAIFYRLRILRYYRDGNKSKWKFDKDLNFRVNVG